MSEARKPRLLDPSFKYVPASKTNIAATFARIRRQLKEAEQAKQAANVRPLKKASK